MAGRCMDGLLLLMGQAAQQLLLLQPLQDWQAICIIHQVTKHSMLYIEKQMVLQRVHQPLTLLMETGQQTMEIGQKSPESI